MSMLRKLPKKAKRVDVVRCGGHRAYVRETFRCIVPGCDRLPIEAMHVVIPGNGRMGSKTGDDRVLPGCSYHHTQANDSYHALGRDKFAQHHGLDLEALIIEVNKDSAPLKRYWLRMKAKELAA